MSSKISGVGWVILCHKKISLTLDVGSPKFYSDLKVALVDDQKSVLRLHRQMVSGLIAEFGLIERSAADRLIDSFSTLPTPSELLGKNLVLLDQNLGLDAQGNDCLGSELALVLSNDPQFYGALVLIVTSDSEAEVILKTPSLRFRDHKPVGATVDCRRKPILKDGIKSVINAHFEISVSTNPTPAPSRRPSIIDRIKSPLDVVIRSPGHHVGISDSIDDLIQRSSIQTPRATNRQDFDSEKNALVQSLICTLTPTRGSSTPKDADPTPNRGLAGFRQTARHVLTTRLFEAAAQHCSDDPELALRAAATMFDENKLPALNAIRSDRVPTAPISIRTHTPPLSDH